MSNIGKVVPGTSLSSVCYCSASAPDGVCFFCNGRIRCGRCGMNPSILSFCVWKTERLLKTLLCLHNDKKISWSSSSAVAKTFLQQRRRLSNSARQKSPPGALQLSASHVFRFLRRVTGWTGRPWSVRFWPSPTTAARAWPWRETLWSAPSPPSCRPPAPRSSRWRWAIAVLVPPSLTRRGTTQLRSHGFLCLLTVFNKAF